MNAVSLMFTPKVYSHWVCMFKRNECKDHVTFPPVNVLWLYPDTVAVPNPPPPPLSPLSAPLEQTQMINSGFEETLERIGDARGDVKSKCSACVF